MKVYSFFRGGINYTDPYVPSRDHSVTAFLPGLSVIPLVQHFGNRANPVVAVGARVREGSLIGRGQGLGSANIHATVPGKVVRTVSWQASEGLANDALIIKLEGGFEKLGHYEEAFPWQGLSPFELQRILAEYGIVEMDGLGRPVSDMFYSFRLAREPLTLVVRCVFDDPWLSADYVLCRERAAAVAEGCAIAAVTGRVSRVVFVFSHGEKELGNMLIEKLGSIGIPVEMVLTGSRYPQRNSRELELVLRRYGKNNGINLGSLLTFGPATLAAIHDAVKYKKPVLERYVAVGGSAIKTPQVMKVRIGTRIGAIFAECGGFVGKPGHIGTGSPLMGRAVVDLDEPVIKTSYAIFAALRDQTGGSARPKCTACGECRAVCPVGLDPEVLYKYTLKFDGERGENAGADCAHGRAAECHGCGCCELVCPSRLPLRSSILRSALKGN